MSQYQYIAFQAIDRPLSNKQLKFISDQSSRADYDEWSYEVEYNYGEFRGDVDGMLRHGYDIFMNYMSYGEREIKISFPDGLPFGKEVLNTFVDYEGLNWTFDETDQSGILTVSPYYSYNPSYVDNFESALDAIAKLRASLLDGDLRVLYLLWLCSSPHTYEFEYDEIIEPPVPHGLGEIAQEYQILFHFFDSPPSLLQAAAEGIPGANVCSLDKDDAIQKWLQTIEPSRQLEILRRLLNEDSYQLKQELLAEVQSEQPRNIWPCLPPSRTFQELVDRSDEIDEAVKAERIRIAEAEAELELQQAEKERQQYLAEIRSNPSLIFEQASQLIKLRTATHYQSATKLLLDIREAIGGSEGNDVVTKYVAQLIDQYPTRSAMKSQFQKAGLTN